VAHEYAGALAVTRKRSGLATSAEIRRVLRLATEFGIDVVAVKIGGDGSVTVVDARNNAPDDESDADAALRSWEVTHGGSGH
jgi:hypothetical protein